LECKPFGGVTDVPPVGLILGQHVIGAAWSGKRWHSETSSPLTERGALTSGAATAWAYSTW
jgi:hypothetical protein